MLARITQSSGKDYYTVMIYYYLCHSLMEHEMCHKCKNYFNNPNKMKQQHERGVRFACEKPKKVGVQLTSTNVNRNYLAAKRKHATDNS